MPYIKSNDRIALSKVIGSAPIESAGELNYLFTKLIIMYMQQNGKGYKQVNDVIGALEGAKLEFYRRVAAPYEDLKANENGDVY